MSINSPFMDRDYNSVPEIQNLYLPSQPDWL